MEKKILVIEDEQTMRLLLERSLPRELDKITPPELKKGSSVKYEIVTKEDGMEALKWLEDFLPDLIICDVHMPNMDGYQFLERIRQNGFTKHTPVVMLSGSSEKSEDRVTCYKLGAQDFLIKPFSPVELAYLVRKNLFPIQYAIKW